jgi:hypothetical protein
MIIFSSCTPPPATVFSILPYAGVIDSFPNTWNDEPVVILDDSTQLSIELQQDSQSNVTSHEVIWYSIRKRNPVLLETVSVPDYETIEDIPTVEATAFYANGESWSLSPNSIARERYSENGIYVSNRHDQQFTIPNYSEGMRIRLSVHRHYIRPQYISRYLIRKEYPAQISHLSFSYPTDSAIKYAFLNAESLHIDTSLITNGKNLVFSITGSMLKKLPLKALTQLPELWLAALNVSFPPSGVNSFSWAQLGDNYLTMIADVLPLIDTTVKKQKGFALDSIAEKVYLSVRSRIRYHAEHEGMFAIHPRSVQQVLSNAYGDCKEMSLVLLSDLQQNGITCGLALIATAGEMQLIDNIPSLENFNHMICYYMRGDGSMRFLDPTVQYGQAFHSYYELIGRKALLLKKNASSIYQVPPETDYRNEITTHAIIKNNSDDNSWLQQGIVKFEGNFAHHMYPYLNGAQEQERIPFLKTFCKEYMNLIVSSLKIDTLHPETIELSYISDIRKNYLAVEKGGILVDAPSTINGNFGITTLELEGPIQFDSFIQHDQWELPKNFVDLESMNIENLFGTGVWKLNGRILSREYSQKLNFEFKSGDPEINSYFKSKRAFSKATVWR